MDITQLTTSWHETKGILMEGLTSAQAQVVDQVLENQRNILINETAASGSTDA